jgi:class 3 adenylate cyclase/tetratricopeptide (TPR) repeat protein
VLFSDLVGSTTLGERLDPEVVRGVLARYFTAMAGVIASHGGTVEKYVGDAIMAVFGLPTIHEDDALRAVRAALAMRDALASLNADLSTGHAITLATRTGIATGEVVAGSPSAGGGPLVTGDVVNTAARLEQAAAPGEILLAVSTWRMVRHAVHVAAVPPVVAKGKAAPVPAVRLLGHAAGDAAAPAPAPRGTPFVGRQAELGHVEASYAAAVAEGRPRLLLVTGPAGVGKSRLVAEALRRLTGRVMVLKGRCLSYGDGITWWPLRGILHAAAGIVEDDDATAARARLSALVAGVRDRDVVAARLAAAIGLSPEPAPLEELHWAVRKTLEMLAEERPLAVLVEDIHWAEPALLDLLEHVVAHAGQPLLLVCTARPELRETAPGWQPDPMRTTALALEGLEPGVMEDLVDAVPGGPDLSPAMRQRAIATAEGNPLFLEELVRMLAGEASPGGDVVQLPPTIGALLAARLDSLPAAERDSAQRASVIGRAFEIDAVTALTPEPGRPGVATALAGLVRREIVIPDTESSKVPGSAADAFRFRHILIRDTAYEGLTKSERADLHERFASWLESIAGDRLPEYQAIVGHHLERAWHFRTELRRGDSATRAIGERAARHLAMAGARARELGDSPAAVELTTRAERLPSPDDGFKAELLLEAGLALWDVGRLGEAGERADDSLAVAMAAGAPRVASLARLLRVDLAIDGGSVATSDPTVRLEREAALRDAEAADDARALAEAWIHLGAQAWNERRWSEAEAATRRAREQAWRAGLPRLGVSVEIDLVVTALSGPTPAGEVERMAADAAARAIAYPSQRCRLLGLQAIAEAMLGRFESARSRVMEGIAIAYDLAHLATIGALHLDLWWVERLAGDARAAEAAARAALDGHPARDQLAMAWCRLAELYLVEGRLGDAQLAADASSAQDSLPFIQPRLAGVRAALLAAAGDPAARAEVERALAMVDGTPYVNQRIDLLIEAAQAMAWLGDRDAALGHAGEALQLAEAKQNLAVAAQVGRLIAGLLSTA